MHTVDTWPRTMLELQPLPDSDLGRLGRFGHAVLGTIQASGTIIGAEIAVHSAESSLPLIPKSSCIAVAIGAAYYLARRARDHISAARNY